MTEKKESIREGKLKPQETVGVLGKAQAKSTHGMYHYMKEAWKHPTQEQIETQRAKLIAWRAGQRIVKIEKPTRLDRARNLGYKAKKGFVVFRVVIERGGRKKARPTTKRRSKRFNIKKMLRMNYRWVAEQRVQRVHQNLEVLNSYLVGQDGKYFFFEVITVDRNAPEIKSDKNLKWITQPANKFRAYRGLTSAGKQSRGLRNRQRNLKIRPSLRAWHRRGR